jgi:16S rRNA (cytosine1402-N4)-methyltransferase
LERPNSAVTLATQGPPGRYHTPVLLAECIDALALKSDGIYVDCTLGDGGHFQAIIDGLGPRGTAIGIDRDPDAIDWCTGHIEKKEVRVELRQERFSGLEGVLDELGIDKVNGILLDLGLSSRQIAVESRGFSYLKDVNLDMRMNPKDSVTAAEFIRSADKETLVRVLSDYGEIRNPSRMAETILRSRGQRTLTTSEELKECLREEYGERLNIKMLAKLFQALRIAVNDELSELHRVCEIAVKRLHRGGRLVIISYHSLEDRFVKNFIRDAENPCRCPPEMPRCICGKIQLLKRITSKAIKASSFEVSRNPASRSARLRAAEKVGES